jgi:hypothetical protein
VTPRAAVTPRVPRSRLQKCRCMLSLFSDHVVC